MLLTQETEEYERTISKQTANENETERTNERTKQNEAEQSKAVKQFFQMNRYALYR